jgi:hypothetical protein
VNVGTVFVIVAGERGRVLRLRTVNGGPVL